MFADDIVRALLAVGRQAAVGEVVADQGLVVGDPGAFENREREARKPTHMDLVGSSTGCSADRVAVRKFDVRELLIPVILELVEHHSRHLGHRVVHTLHPTKASWGSENCEWWHPYCTPTLNNGEFGYRAQRVGEGRVAAFHVRN